MKDAGVSGDDVAAIALDTTGSTVIRSDERLEPLDDYYLWCDHRAKRRSRARSRRRRVARSSPAIDWCGGVYSSEWGFAKLLHWLRHNPDKRARFATALEHCDMVAATLCGITDPTKVPRSVCAMGHKWLWNESLGGLPSEEFLVEVDPLLAGVRAKLDGGYRTSDHDRRTSCRQSGRRGSDSGRHSDPGRRIRRTLGRDRRGRPKGDVVNVIGTSTCIIAIAKTPNVFPGVCGVVPGSVHPGYVGVEAGLSAVGDIFEAIACRAEHDGERALAGGSTAIAPDRRVSCAWPGTTATARCSSTRTSAA